MSQNETAEDGRLWVPISDAALRLGVHRNTVTRAIDDGDIPFITFRGTRRIAAALVTYVVAAINSGRSGAVEDFAAEWVAEQQQKANAS